MRPEQSESRAAAAFPDDDPERRPGEYYVPRGYGVMTAREVAAVPYGSYFADAPTTTRNEPDYRDLTARLLARVKGIILQIADERREIDRLRRETRAILDSLPTLA